MSSKTPAKFVRGAVKAVAPKKTDGPVILDDIIDVDSDKAELSEYNGKMTLKMYDGSDFGMPLGMKKLTTILKNLGAIKRFVVSGGKEC